MFNDHFKQVWKIVRRLPGWMPRDDAAFLFDAAMAAERLEGVIVEIGSYKGRSACIMAFGGTSEIYCVDPWQDLGTGFPLSVHDFWNTVNRFDFKARIHALQGRSADVRPTFDKPIKLLFIDGNHTYEDVKRDYELWEPLVVHGGWILFHDYSVEWPDVKKFVDEFSDIQPVVHGCVAGFQKGSTHARQ